MHLISNILNTFFRILAIPFSIISFAVGSIVGGIKLGFKYGCALWED